MKTASKYRLHRTIAIVVVPLLLISSATGFFRANQKWYWEEGYKKKKHPSTFSINADVVSIPRMIEKTDSFCGKKNKFEVIHLREENGRLYYELITSDKKKFLAETVSGNIVSPISAELACGIASQYVKGTPPVKSCSYIESYLPRKSKDPRAVYLVEFDNEVESRIYLETATGEVVEDIDKNRTFGMWVVKLHDYDFFDSKRSISSIVGIGALILGISGIWIYRFRKEKLKKGKV